MPKRLHMSSADYLAIAVSPALVMALVGSLVFFLIEVLYVGQYQARLNYVFALFVFAAVLVARISIEMGSERAAMYSLPLAGAVFVVLLRFVEHPSIFSPLINLVLIALVWWSAHKLTWDCTFIDDDEDSSGEGLMQRVGADDSADVSRDMASKDKASVNTPNRKTNELAADETEKVPLWRRLFTDTGQKHTPGVWVLYFSLAALPLFGVLQGFIPASDAASRRWAFAMLFVYVGSGLCLLVTTSFLGFRRYLRQRQIEMPAAMAITWVGMGGALVAVVLLLAMLLPRPAAEYAIAQPPWQFGSPEGLTSSRWGRGNDAPNEDPREQQQPGTAETDNDDAPAGSRVDDQQHRESADGKQGEREGGQSQSEGGQETGDSGRETGDRDQESGSGNQESGDGGQEAGESDAADDSQNSQRSERQQERNSDAQDPSESASQNDGERDESPASQGNRVPERSTRPSPAQVMQNISTAVGSLFNLLKWLVYLVLGAVALYFAWKYRHELLTAARELWRDLRALLARLMGNETAPAEQQDQQPATTVTAKRRSFREFANPFENGRHQQASPAELVRYTFEAFEAWCGDRGVVRRADQTPHELVRQALGPEDPLAGPARRLAQLYGEAAYSGGTMSPSRVTGLAELWRLMQQAPPAARELEKAAAIE